METLLNSILTLLVEPPGNLIYHLVLAFAVIASFQVAIISRRSREDAGSKRLVFGLGMLLLGQVVLYICSGLAWQNIIDGQMLLPVIDRTILLFNLVWLIWLWAFPSPAKLGDLITGFLNIGIVILFLFSYTSWAQQSSLQHFNNTWIDLLWGIAGLALALTGMLILLFSRLSGWEFGVGMFSLIAAGIAAHLFLPSTEQDFSSYMRLGQLAAFPLLPTLLYRVSQPTPVARIAQDSDKSVPSTQQVPFPRNQERRRYSADPRTVHAWLSLANTSDPQLVFSGMAKALAHTMLADICFIVTKIDQGQMTLQAGYDLILDENLPGRVLDRNTTPTLVTAWQRGKPLIMNAKDTYPDLKGIYSTLGLQEPGSLLFIPLMKSADPVGGILFLSPYSNRQWNTDDQGYLASDMEAITEIILQAHQSSEGLRQVSKVSESISAELESLRHDNQILLQELEEYRKTGQDAAQGASHFDLNALVALQQEAQEQITSLQLENDRLRTQLANVPSSAASPDDVTRLEKEIRGSLQEIAMLQNQLAEANAINLALENNVSQGDLKKDDLEVITSIVQEIRQPIASIGGYTDLLLNESVGILGTLQRKFLERIEASTERLRSSLDDLIRVTILSEGPLELLPQSIDLETVVDSAVADTTAQLREKDIALKVDLPESMPRIFADRDAIQQIIMHLLHNAGAITPQEGAIALKAQVQKEDDAEFLLIQVTDTGGGIRPEDLPRVFSRHYRADRPLIQGLGDTGVGLSIAKTLVEAHNGRIWVDSVFGQSTTISVLLPMQPDAAATKMK